MISFFSKYGNLVGVSVLLVATCNLAFAQQGSVASLHNGGRGLPPNVVNLSESAFAEQAALARFVAAETKVREALNQHTFKRDVVLQTIGPNGEVTGEYLRNSQFIFDDRGQRIERVIFHPSSTIHEMRITKEDIQDLEGGQLLGIDIVEATKYQLTYAGAEIVEGRQLFAVDITPLVQPDPKRMKNRFFVGRVWVDPTTFQIVRIKGVVEPQGKQRFPMFMTWREPIKEALAFPTRTEADDVLHFRERDVHYRIKVRYYDYKEFASKVAIKDVDEDDIGLEEPASEMKKSPAKAGPASGNKIEPSSKISKTLTEVPTHTIAPLKSSEVCTTNRNSPPVGEYHWPADSEVKVYFARNKFSPEQSAVLLEAMRGWNSASVDNGSGVKFIYAGEIDRRANCRSCLTVDRRDVFARDKHHYAFFHPMNQEEGRLLVSAWIDFDFGITEPNALQGFMAHELGHGLGLWDCPTCKNKRSLMNSFPSMKKHNGLTMPSSCDLATMRIVYQEERQIASSNRSVDKRTEPVGTDAGVETQTLNIRNASLSVVEEHSLAGGATAANSRGDKRSGLTKLAPQRQTSGNTNFFAAQPTSSDDATFSAFGLKRPYLYKFLF
jgi:hypothetical protein